MARRPNGGGGNLAGSDSGAGEPYRGVIGDIDTIDPIDGFGAAGTSVRGTDGGEPLPERRGRGRPRKDGTPTRQTAVSSAPVKPDTLIPAILIVHNVVLARVAPEFECSEDEAKSMATAACNYLRHTKIKLDPKTRDFYALLWVVGLIEVPKVAAAMLRISALRAAQKQQREMADSSTVNVVAMPAQGNAPGVVPVGGWQMPTAGNR